MYNALMCRYVKMGWHMPPTPLKSAHSCKGRDLNTHLTYGYLGSQESAPNGISTGSAVFVQLTHVPNTQTDMQTTLRAMSVATGHISFIHSYSFINTV